MSLARERPGGRTATGLWIGIGIALLVLLGAGLWAYQRTRPQSAVVEKRTIVAVVPVEGEVVVPPGERAEVAAPFESPVVKVYATVGATVKRGDVLVELSLPNAQVAYQQARDQVRAAETAYANAKKQWDAAVATAQGNVETARAQEKTALQPQDVSIDTSGEGASVTIRPPAAETQAAAQAAAQARAQAEQDLARVQAQRDAALAPARQQLEDAREYFRSAQAGRKQALVRAPISGTLLTLNARPGATVGKNRNEAIATIVDLDELELQAEVKPHQAGYLKKAMPATVTVTEVPNEQFEGELEGITTDVSGLLKRQRFLAVLDLKNRRGLIKPGMKARGSIKAGEAKDVVVVPVDALQEDAQGRPVVEVLRQGQWQKVVVEPGLSDGRHTEIRSGVRLGETVKVEPDLV